MTTVNKCDWRIAYTRKIIITLSNAINEIYKQTDFDGEEYLIDEKREIVDNLIGMAFIVAQLYVTGTIADAKLFAKSTDQIGKAFLLRKYSELIPKTNVTKMELCDAFANYYKHHEEWVRWSKNDKNQKTIEILLAVGLEEFGEVPLGKVIELLLTTEHNFTLDPLISIIIDWRSTVMDSIIEE